VNTVFSASFNTILWDNWPKGLRGKN